MQIAYNDWYKVYFFYSIMSKLSNAVHFHIFIPIVCISTIMVYVCQLFTMLMVIVHSDTCQSDCHFKKNDIYNVWIHMHRQAHDWGI